MPSYRRTAAYIVTPLLGRPAPSHGGVPLIVGAGNPATRHQPPEVAVVVVPRLARREPVACEVGCQHDVLFTAELQEQSAAGPEEPRRMGDHATYDAESVVAAVEGAHR